MRMLELSCILYTGSQLQVYLIHIYTLILIFTFSLRSDSLDLYLQLGHPPLSSLSFLSPIKLMLICRLTD